MLRPSPHPSPAALKGKGHPMARDRRTKGHRVASSQCASSCPCWFCMAEDPSLCPMLYHHYLLPRTPNPTDRPGIHTSEDRAVKPSPDPKEQSAQRILSVTIISAFRSHFGKVGGGAGQSEDSLPVHCLQDRALNTFQACS